MNININTNNHININNIINDLIANIRTSISIIISISIISISISIILTMSMAKCNWISVGHSDTICPSSQVHLTKKIEQVL